MELELVRVAVGDAGAFGVLVDRSVPFAITLEHTYDPGNTVKIPDGFHRCVRTQYHKGGYETFEIIVPGHSRLLFHKGNVETDSEGCVLVGRRFGTLGGRQAILQSAVGFADLMERTTYVDEFDLSVRTA